MTKKKADTRGPGELRRRTERRHPGARGGVTATPADPTRLAHELQVHQVELEMQNEKLQRWQGVMLGRENRVQELKREVNELCRSAGQPARYPSQEGEPAAPAPKGPGA